MVCYHRFPPNKDDDGRNVRSVEQLTTRLQTAVDEAQENFRSDGWRPPRSRRETTVTSFGRHWTVAFFYTRPNEHYYDYQCAKHSDRLSGDMFISFLSPNYNSDNGDSNLICKQAFTSYPQTGLNVAPVFGQNTQTTKPNEGRWVAGIISRISLPFAARVPKSVRRQHLPENHWVHQPRTKDVVITSTTTCILV